MKELKNLIINQLCEEYSVLEATNQVENAEIIIKGNIIKVIYDNGVMDVFELVTVEYLKQIS